MYNLRIGKPIHAGPYAMLVKEVAWRSAEMGNHDYLNIPEIMQDICNGYHARHGENIHDELHRRLRATVIRFWSNAKQGVDCTESALYYLYCIVRGERLSICANTCLDGKNTVVSALQVESVKQYSLRNETVMRKQYRQVTEQRALSPPVHVHFLAEDSAL
jgi:hypothetical protein